MSRRVRIDLSYDGTDFHGWQVQPGLSTVQGVLEEVVGAFDGKYVHVAGSGRTDAGVHAERQVAAFTLENPIPPANLRMAVNKHLPPSIRILTAVETDPEFHPRFDAAAKTYRYVLFRGEICSPFEWRYVHHHPYSLDEDAMIEAASAFVGEHDFTALSAKDSRDAEGKSKVRTIFASGLTRERNCLIYTVRGSGFLKHMVRKITGTLLEVGKGNFDRPYIQRLLEAPGSDRPRAMAGPTVPAKGLTLVSVEY